VAGVTISLVRHAKAGVRKSWRGPDELRPLSKAGRNQAKALAKTLLDQHDGEIARVMTSPYTRCRQTFEPLAEELGLPVEESEALIEGASLADALRLVDQLGDQHAVFCTHGDVLGALLAAVQRRGVALPDQKMEKGGTWVLETDDGNVVSVRYVPPPAVPS
jgi:phosphohistidine phosphatase SixA